MDYKDQLIERINQFTIGVVEEFKEAEVAIFEDSRFSRIFKNKDYDGHLETIRKCKKNALNLSLKDIEIPEDDVQSKDLVRYTERCIMSFSSVCDAYIQLQLMLRGKAEGEKLGFIEYKKQYKRVEEARKTFNDLLRELDIAYTDYTEDHTDKGSGGEFLTYDDIAGDDD